MLQENIKDYKYGLKEFTNGSFEHDPTLMTTITNPDFLIGIVFIINWIYIIFSDCIFIDYSNKRAKEKEKQLISKLRNHDRTKYGYYRYKNQYGYCNKVKASERECIKLYNGISSPMDYDLFLYKCITCKASNSNNFIWILP